MAILVVFLITAVLVKVHLDALPFFIITMVKIMLINCKQGWEGIWGKDFFTYPHPSFRPIGSHFPRGNGCCGLSVFRGLSRQRPGLRVWAERRATERQRFSGRKEGITGTCFPHEPQPAPSLLMPALFPQRLVPSCRAACLVWLASCLLTTQPPS